MTQIKEFFQIFVGMKLTDYIDIILVAMIIYGVIRLLRSANALRVALVVVGIIAVAWITEAMKLYALSYILDSVLQVGILALIILFQPELRRMLDHLGSIQVKKLFSAEKEMEDMREVIRQTVLACEIMSREKVGALIVFARENRLDEYYKSGTMIDAKVSDPLLRNIFFHNSPLHDGALIISQCRVVCAGCVLPLSVNPRIPKELGTRHHAAVGMGEASDAVVVVVSEETGTISVAYGGMLKRFLAPQTLERLLIQELCPTEQQTPDNLAVILRQKLHKKDKEEKG